jgi:hypothetical protein
MNVDVLPIMHGATHAFVCYNSGQRGDTYALTGEVQR